VIHFDIIMCHFVCIVLQTRVILACSEQMRKVDFFGVIQPQRY